MDFLEITNPRAVLERALRSFSCVTVGDQICIPHNDKFYHIEVRPSLPSLPPSLPLFLPQVTPPSLHPSLPPFRFGTSSPPMLLVSSRLIVMWILRLLSAMSSQGGTEGEGGREEGRQARRAGG